MVRAVNPAPDNHFTAGPDRGVSLSVGRRVGGASGCPTVGDGVVSAAGVQKAAKAFSAPDDHFAASPNCGVLGSGIGGVAEAGWSPRVIGAATRRTSYNRKRVGDLP